MHEARRHPPDRDILVGEGNPAKPARRIESRTATYSLDNATARNAGFPAPPLKPPCPVPIVPNGSWYGKFAGGAGAGKPIAPTRWSGSPSAVRCLGHSSRLVRRIFTRVTSGLCSIQIATRQKEDGPPGPAENIGTPRRLGAAHPSGSGSLYGARLG